MNIISRRLFFPPLQRTTVRKMTTGTPTKHEWIVILPDQAGALKRRMEVRPYVASTQPHRTTREHDPLTSGKQRTSLEPQAES